MLALYIFEYVHSIVHSGHKVSIAIIIRDYRLHVDHMSFLCQSSRRSSSTRICSTTADVTKA